MVTPMMVMMVMMTVTIETGADADAVRNDVDHEGAGVVDDGGGRAVRRPPAETRITSLDDVVHGDAGVIDDGGGRAARRPPAEARTTRRMTLIMKAPMMSTMMAAARPDARLRRRERIRYRSAMVGGWEGKRSVEDVDGDYTAAALRPPHHTYGRGVNG